MTFDLKGCYTGETCIWTGALGEAECANRADYLFTTGLRVPAKPLCRKHVRTAIEFLRGNLEATIKPDKATVASISELNYLANMVPAFPTAPEIPGRCPGTLSARYSVVMEVTVTVTDDGNITPQGSSEEQEIIDAYSLFCSKCGHLAMSEFSDHGVAEDYEME